MKKTWVSSPGGAGWSFSIPLSQLLCRLVCAQLPFVCMTRIQICVHVKDPISICHKRVGLIASGVEIQKHCTQGKRKKRSWVAPYYSCLLSLWKAAHIVHALHWDKRVMSSHLTQTSKWRHYNSPSLSVRVPHPGHPLVVTWMVWAVCRSHWARSARFGSLNSYVTVQTNSNHSIQGTLILSEEAIYSIMAGSWKKKKKHTKHAKTRAWLQVR